MHCKSRFFFFHALFATCVTLLCGCGKKAEPYDSLRGEILVDLATALDANDSSKVTKALDRLEPLTDVNEFVTRLREQEQTRAVIHQLNDYLERAEVKQAREFLNRTSTTTNPALRKISEKITALETFRDYLAGMPYLDSVETEEALETMKRHTGLFRSSPVFQQWLDQQETALARLQQKEHQAKLNVLLDACDQALDTQAVNIEVTFAHLLAFSSNAAASKLHTSLRDGDPRVALKLLGTATPLSDVELKSLEICFLANKSHLSPGNVKAILAEFPNRPPQSLAGHAITVTRFANERKPADALLGFRLYLDAGGTLSGTRARDLCSQAVFPIEHFNARPWRVTCPTVDNLLGLFTQWHDFHTNEANGK